LHSHIESAGEDRAYALRGVRDAAGAPALVLMASMVGVGGLAHDVGYPLLAGALSTVLIWAGPAQVLLFGSLAAGVAVPAIAVAICFSSIRFLPMTVSLLPLLRRPGLGIWHLLLAAHLIAVTNWTEGMRRLPDVPRPNRYAYFLGFGFTTFAAATLATGAGYHLIGALPSVLAGALLFTTPLFFSISLTAGARQPWEFVALGFGFGLAPVATWLVGREFDLLVSGLVAGLIAVGVHRRGRRRRGT